MAKPELGTKRKCLSCAAKFYDLGKDPIVCPKCETEFSPEPILPARTPRPVDKTPPPKEEKPEVVEKDPAAGPNVELVSLEDADDETKDEDLAAIEVAEEIADLDTNDDDDNKPDDNTFLETDDEDEPDVSGLIGGGIAKPKEGA
jgi:uncharacterized protein (TIGR02300 family)